MSMGVLHFWQYSPGALLSAAMVLSGAGHSRALRGFEGCPDVHGA